MNTWCQKQLSNQLSHHFLMSLWLQILEDHNQASPKGCEAQVDHRSLIHTMYSCSLHNLFYSLLSIIISFIIIGITTIIIVVAQIDLNQKSVCTTTIIVVMIFVT